MSSVKLKKEFIDFIATSWLQPCAGWTGTYSDLGSWHRCRVLCGSPRWTRGLQSARGRHQSTARSQAHHPQSQVRPQAQRSDVLMSAYCHATVQSPSTYRQVRCRHTLPAVGVTVLLCATKGCSSFVESVEPKQVLAAVAAAFLYGDPSRSSRASGGRCNADPFLHTDFGRGAGSRGSGPRKASS